MPKIKWHHRNFIVANGDPPWPCYFCREPVIGLMINEGVIHHLDENHENNDPDNLVAMHHDCHTIWHQVGKKRTQQTRDRIANALRGKVKSPEHVEALKRNHQGMRGKKHSLETRAKMSASRLKWLSENGP